MFAAIAAEDRYRFDLESKAFAFALAGQLPLGKHQLAINLLPGSLYHHPDAVGWLMDSLLAAGLRPDQVLIEVTETEVITCFDQFRKVLKALRVAGMKLAIDDFGAGYSGLSLLTRFQPDKSKWMRNWCAISILAAPNRRLSPRSSAAARILALRWWLKVSKPWRSGAGCSRWAYACFRAFSFPTLP